MDDIAKLLIDGHFSAISIDTSVFRDNGFVLASDLGKMEQFCGDDIKFILVDVVFKEVLKNYAKHLEEIACGIPSVLKRVGKHFDVDMNRIEELLSSVEPAKCENVANTNFKNYIERCGAEVLNSSGYVDLSAVLDDYFASRLPFESTKGKKSEFPDAFILKTLDGWAQKNSGRVLLVSSDKGIGRYCEKSRRICCVDELPKALNIIQYQKGVTEFAHKLSEFVTSQEGEEFRESIFEMVEDQVRSESIDVEAESSARFDYSWHIDSVDYIEFDLINSAGDVFYILKVEDNVANLMCRVNFRMTISCSFDLYMWDSIDKEEVYLASKAKDIEFEEQAYVDIELKSDVFGAELEFDVKSIQVRSMDIHADAGYIEPFDSDPSE